MSKFTTLLSTQENQYNKQESNSVDDLVNTIRPVDPIYCIRPNSIKLACSWFKKKFPGQILYAVKTNPNEKIVKQIIANGISEFDVASLNEIKLVINLHITIVSLYQISSIFLIFFMIV